MSTTWKDIQPELEAFQDDPIRYIRDHPKGIQFILHTNHHDNIKWSRIVHPDNAELVQGVTGIKLKYTRQDSWDDICSNLDIQPSCWLSLYDRELQNMDYEWLDKVYEELDLDWSNARNLYYIPKWFYQKHNLTHDLSLVQKVIMQLTKIMEEWIINYQKCSNTKRADH